MKHPLATRQVPLDGKEPIKVHDVIRYKSKHRNGTDVATVKVTSVERRVREADGAVAGIYFSYSGISGACGTHGCLWLYDEPREFGIQTFEVLRNEPPRPAAPLPNLVGHPGYDLVHDPVRRLP